MIPLLVLLRHEAQALTRRAMWPVAMTLHAAVAAAFVVIWGPTNGIPLWEASVLDQLTAAERIFSAVLLTWLTTYALSDDEARDLADWSALTGRAVQSVFSARLALAALVAIVFTIVALPAFAAAGESSAATSAMVARQAGAALGFGLFSVGVTAVVCIALRNQVAVWCTAMAISLIAAVGVQVVDETWLRAGAPLAAGVALVWMAAAGITSRRTGRAD